VAVFDVDRARAEDVSARVARTGHAFPRSDAGGCRIRPRRDASPLGMAAEDPVPIVLDGVGPGCVVATSSSTRA
jgi:hypothetical protein